LPYFGPYFGSRERATRRRLGEWLVRAVFVVLAVAFLLSGCFGSDKPIATAGDAASEHNLKRDCADAKWKEQNLGLWYSLCRQPLHW
jgi:hypothetical protein